MRDDFTHSDEEKGEGGTSHSEGRESGRKSLVMRNEGCSLGQRIAPAFEFIEKGGGDQYSGNSDSRNDEAGASCRHGTYLWLTGISPSATQFRL